MRLFLKRVALGILFCFVFASAWSLAQTSQPQAADSQAQRLALMKSKGTEASLSILPVRLAGRPFDRVTEVVGLLLEQQGLKTIELGRAIFEPAPKVDLQGLAISVSEFVRGQPVTTDYVLYAEINGSREAGLNELIALSTQSFTYFQSKGGFVEGSPEDLPRGRREKYEQSGRNSKVLVKKLKGYENTDRG